MQKNVEKNSKNEKYEKLLEQAVKYPPISVFTDPGVGEKGLYRVEGNAVRTFYVADVERKRKELNLKKQETDEKS